MASKSDYLENKILDHALGKTSFTMPANVYLGLWTSALTDASTGATAGEAAYTGYTRVQITGASLAAAASGASTNTSAYVFPACTAGTSTVTFFAILDSATIGAGNILYWGTVASTVISTTQTPPTVDIGALDVTED